MNVLRSLCLLALAVAPSAAAFAQGGPARTSVPNSFIHSCYEFTGAKPDYVGAFKLAAPADALCVYAVGSPSRPQFIGLNFRAGRKNVGYTDISSSVSARCPGFCYGFELKSGVMSSGLNRTQLNGHSVSFQVEGPEGTMTISSPNTGSDEYAVRTTSK